MKIAGIVYIGDIINYLSDFSLISFYASLVGTLGVFLLIIFIKIRKSELFIGTIKKLSILFILLWLITLLLNGFIVYSKMTDKTLSYLSKGTSTDVKSGTVFLSTDRLLPSESHSIDLPANGDDIQITFWDFASEDGDSLQMYINNSSKTAPFAIAHTAKVVKIPRKSCNLVLRGTKDVDGKGITYAIQFNDTGETFFNSIRVKDSINYKIICK